MGSFRKHRVIGWKIKRAFSDPKINKHKKSSFQTKFLHGHVEQKKQIRRAVSPLHSLRIE